MIPSKHILIVEDERIVARDLQRSLTDLGYDVPVTAATADHALRLASERCPDLVLMDIRIKGERDGIETASILRARFGVPVIYLTAYADDATVARAKMTEPLGYLLKPVKPNELRSTVEIALYRHEMERRLRVREHWFSSTLNSVADAVVTVDLAGNVSFMNPAAELLTGVKQAEALGRPARAIVSLRDAAESRSPLDEALASRKAVVVQEAALESAASAGRIISDSAAPVLDRDNLLGAVMVFRDVTEQKHVQKKLELADRLASLGTMAAGVAHELNNPLGVVGTNATICHDALASVLSDESTRNGLSAPALLRIEQAMACISQVQIASTRMAKIVADLNVFSRPDVNALGQTDVVRAIEWAIRSTSTELSKRARILTEFASVPPVTLEETKLGQVLVNLLVNAMHAIGPGQREANEVHVKAELMADGRVLIAVRDTGSGMPPELAKRVFEPFFTTKPVGVGTGLGLSLCHGMVAAVGGAIEVESKVGKGTTFRVFLPTATVTEEVRESDSTQPRSLASNVARKGRILVIDDEEMLLRVAKLILRKHDVVCALNARDGLSLLETEPGFDIIICDLMMASMNGMMFYEELLKTRPADAKRVVFCSGGATGTVFADFLATVPNPKLYKPYTVSELEEMVQRLLAGTSRSH